jgi:hypothetical protein
MGIWNILRPFGIFYGHFGNLVVLWYIFLCFGILYQGIFGNPGHEEGVVRHENNLSCKYPFNI